jgi:GAF domain-containing protein
VPGGGAYAQLQAENENLKRSLGEALEQQAATAKILGVISSSPTDVQPVFDTIVRSATRLCGGNFGLVLRFDGTLLHVAAHNNVSPEGLQELHHLFPRPLDEGSLSARALRDGRIHQSADVRADADAPAAASRMGRLLDYRSEIVVPMLRGSTAIGTLSISRSVGGLFPDEQVELLKTFADQAVIAIENVRLFTELEARNRDLTDALSRQTATSEILGAISSSPTDVQPVFDTIVRNARGLCGADTAAVLSYDGEMVRHESLDSHTPEQAAALRNAYPRPADQGHATGRAIRTGRPVHIPDVREDPSYGIETLRDTAGLRSLLSVPLMRDGVAIGAITAQRWVTARPFSESQIALLRTFADQAVIAIENVRLFKELQEKNDALTQAHAQVTEALEQQTATSEILRAIGQSPTDAQPVFDAIVRNAVRLCEGLYSFMGRFDGERLHFTAHYNFTPDALEIEQRLYPYRPDRRRVAGRVILTRSVVHVEDVLTDPEYPQDVARAGGWRAVLGVPLLREGSPLGAITVIRARPGPFSPTQVELLKTFADQAVIAIENVRLFTELGERNRDLTATGEILRVISRSPTDLQPIFDTIAEHAMRLCNALHGVVLRFDGELIHLVAIANASPEAGDALRGLFPTPLGGHTAASRAILTGTTVDIPDAQNNRDYTVTGAARTAGYRSIVAVPMLRDGRAIGTLNVHGAEVGQFSQRQIQLLQTFADQAVIAIENVRLFKELEARTQDLTRSVEELTALGEVGRALSSTLDLESVLRTIVARATQLSGTEAGVIYEYNEAREVFLPSATERLEPEILQAMLATPVRKGEGATGRLAEGQEPIEVPDILAAPGESRVRGALVRAGYRALLAVPLLREDRLLGGLTVIRKTTGRFSPEVIELLRTFATQSALAIQNARLFQEIEAKSRELQVASQHKSEFLANMSHELRTPLNAIIGYSELLEEEAGDVDGGRLVPDLQKIATAAKHQLSLINDILDLSKVEAGRMELEVADFDLPTAIDNALTLVRERATRRGIALGSAIDERVGTIRADERKVKQVILNLLSNALKFTPEGGRIDVRAAVNGQLVEVSVADTGVGIAPEDQEAVFEEFRQVGTADKKVEGTGLGLALARKFVELHGGRIWVKSQPGLGSTFTFALPVRRED